MFFLVFGVAMPQNVRPIRDNVGFCWKPSEMNMLIKYLDSHFKNGTKFPSKNLVAAISPHDDYLYAASVYYPLYRLIKTKEVVIFGVTHGTVRKELGEFKNKIILDNFKQWRGPYSNVDVSFLREIIKKNLDTTDFIVNHKAQTIEHSIEALIPFLQYYNRNIKITPIMVTEMPFDTMKDISTKLAFIISNYIKQNNLKLGKDIFFLISSDANHYGTDFNNSPFGEDENAHKDATMLDIKIANSDLKGTLSETTIYELTQDLWGKQNTSYHPPLWCGKFSIPFGLLTINKIIENTSNKNLEGIIFGYSDTWTEGVIPIKHTNLGLTAPFSLKHWVGHFSAGFYLK
jgi:AmmeMemoRadiSam system protein B